MKIDIVIPSFKSRYLTMLAIRSFERHSTGFDFRYIVVENSDDESYKEDVQKISDRVVWVQNPTKYTNSEANASAIHKAMEHLKAELVFICHNDVMAVHPNWMKYLHTKIQEGNHLVGTVLDNSRIEAVHISGLLTYSEIVKSVDHFPTYDEVGRQILDVGDVLTQYCRDNNLDYFCYRNTENYNIDPDSLPSPYDDFPVDRSVDDDGEVFFLHLGRGTPKTLGSYSKLGKVYVQDWVKFAGINL